MFGRGIGAVWVGIVVLAFTACGGGGDSTPTPSGSALGNETPNINLPPADAVVFFGSPEVTNSALRQAIAAGSPSKFFFGSGSRDDASFDGVQLPAEAAVLGASLIATSSAEFAAAYEGAFGEPVDAAPGIREAYDAVYLAALAAVAANSTSSLQVQSHFHYVANSPGQVATFGSAGFAEARGALEAGGDVNYIGASGQVDLTANGDISKGQTEVWRIFGDQILGQEFRDVDLAAEIAAEVPPGIASRAAEAPNAALRIGAILNLAAEGALQNAMQMAIDEINASGGVFSADVELLVEDDGGAGADAVSAAEELAEDGVSVIISGSGEASAQAVADESANPTSVPVITLAASPSLPINANEGFWRITAAPLLETPVIANLAIEAEVGVVCILYEANAGSAALANAFRVAFEHKEGDVRALVEVTDEVNLSACLGT